MKKCLYCGKYYGCTCLENVSFVSPQVVDNSAGIYKPKALVSYKAVCPQCHKAIKIENLKIISVICDQCSCWFDLEWE